MQLLSFHRFSFPLSGMPGVKANCGNLKSISCPQCGKKFHSETNILQHMNQPLGSCGSATWNWHEDCAHWFSQPQQPPLGNSMPGSSVNQQVCSPSPNRNMPMGQLDDWDLNPLSPGASDSTMDIPEEVMPPMSGFVETYEGCR